MTISAAAGPRARRLAGVVMLALVTGCASAPGADPRDPWEGYNLGMYRFNDALDTAVLKPVATTYQELALMPVRTGVSNFFANIGDAWSFVNNALQLRLEPAM